MSNTDDWGVASRDWITPLNDDDWIIFVSNGSTITVKRSDFGVEVHHVNPTTGETKEFDGTPFAHRAGAMETVRRWLRDNNLTMIPSPEQAARPWHGASKNDGTGASMEWDHSYRAKYDAKITPTRITGPSLVEPPPDDPTSPEAGAGIIPAEFDPLAFAASLSLARDVLDNAPVPEADRAVYDPVTRYWYHPESGSFFTTEPGEPDPAEPCDELTKEEYDAQSILNTVDPEPAQFDADAFAAQLAEQLKGNKP
jgi:hypothetical protein